MTDEQNKNRPLPPPFFGKPKSFDLQGLIDPTVSSTPSFAPPKTQTPPKQESPYASQEAQKPADSPTDTPTTEENIPGPVYGGGYRADASLASLIQPEQPEEDSSSERRPKEKKNTSFEMNMDMNLQTFRRYMQLFMQQLNHYAEKYHKPLLILNLIWAFLMTSVYIGGITFFALFFNFYYKFTPIVENYLNSRQLSNISFHVSNHNLSEITLSDIKDDKGLFKIKTIKLQYTFMNLLKKKISFADIDGLTIQVNDKGQAGFNLDDFMTLFDKLGIFGDGEIKIQSVQLRNAKVIIGNKEYQIPVDFSGVGDMESKNQFVIPFTYNGTYIQAQSKLTVSFSNIGTSWSLVLENGKITLPDMPAETIKGTIVLKTSNRRLSSLTAALTLQKDFREKILNVKITPAKEKYVNIETTLNITNGPKEKPFTAELNLFNVSVGEDWRSLKTADSVNIVLKNIQTSFLDLESVQANLTGTLDCRNNSCQYIMTQPSTLILFNPQKKFYETTVTASYPVRIILTPQKAFLFTLKQNQLTFDALIQEGSYDFQKKNDYDENKAVKLEIKNTRLSGDYHLLEKTGTLKITGTATHYEDNLISVEKAAFQTETTTDGTSLALISPEINLVSEYLKIPFGIDLQIDKKQYFTALVTAQNGMIDLKGNGYFNAYTGDFLTSVETDHPIVFKKDGLQPYDISSFFSKRVKQLDGSIQIKGYLHFVNALNVSGPLHLMFNDVSFSHENIKVDKLNTLLSISSLVPFGTSQAQTAFFQSLTTVIPFRGVDTTFYFDAIKKQLNVSKMTMDIAGEKFRVDPVWIPYQSPTQTFVFKDKNFNLSELAKHINLPDFQMKGKGTAGLTVLMDDGVAQIKNVEISIPGEGFIRYTPKKIPEGVSKDVLEALENLEFREATIQMSELANKTFEIVIIAMQKHTTERRKKTVRFNLPITKDFLLPDDTLYELPPNLFK